MSGSERGETNRRKPFRRRNEGAAAPRQEQKQAEGKKKREKTAREVPGGNMARSREPKPGGPPRLKWTPVKIPATPLPVFACPLCGKPIKDLAAAVPDRNSGEPVHFDCILEKITEAEAPDSGDIISYIGAGRFGVLHWQNPQDMRSFRIKRIIEWENKENRADWRKLIADRYSMT